MVAKIHRRIAMQRKALGRHQARRLFVRGAIDIAADHGGAFAGELQGRDAPLAATGARNQGNFSS